ncbi:uncharacterized protein LOC128209375 [Mya arenaria]|uniref:uncharacterized protein LOC128209375 n=1 Tax=Mya arenaria TaxID=6604 RepID=UPI0022E58DF7|nr:uncharacterized protein LOC128209375 [Mya arenaria]
MEIIRSILLIQTCFVVSCLCNSTTSPLCREMKPCTIDSGKSGMCLHGTCYTHVDPETRHLSILVTAQYPANTLQAHGGRSLYMRGNGLGLSWNKGIEMGRSSKDTWSMRFNYKSTPKGFQCEPCYGDAVLPNKLLQFRILVDDHNDMMGANFALKLPVSAASAYFKSKPEFVFHPWFYTNSGSLSNLTVASQYIGGRRDVAVWRPPSFLENPFKSYPVVIVFDVGPNEAESFKYIFDELVYPTQVSQEAIVVAFGDYKIQNRHTLMTPSMSVDYECINGTFEDMCGFCLPDFSTLNATHFLQLMINKCGKRTTVGGLGEQTLDFLINEAMPEANRSSSGRIQPGRYGILGYSLGGLMSCHAAWTRSAVFSFAACMSPSFWWPLNNETNNLCDFDFNNKTLKNPAYAVNRPSQRIFIDAGGLENDNPYNLTQAAIDAAHAISSHENYKLDENVWIEISPLEKHNNLQSLRRMQNAFSVLLPIEGEAAMPSQLYPIVPDLVG